HLDLLSFPTRRSSDLYRNRSRLDVAVGPGKQGAVTRSMHHHVFEEDIMNLVPCWAKHLFFKHRPYIVCKREFHLVFEKLLYKASGLNIAGKDYRRLEVLPKPRLRVCHGDHFGYGSHFRDIAAVGTSGNQYHVWP